MPITDQLLRYAKRIRELRQAHAAVQEPAIAPAFQELLTSVLMQSMTGRGLTVVPEFVKVGVGRPDIALVRPGEPARAYVELKSIDKQAHPGRWRLPHDKQQADRLRELHCWATSNFVEIYLFERADERGTARIVPERALDPDCSDAAADRLIRRHDASAFIALVDRLAAGAGQAPAARDARELAQLLAHSSRLVRSIVSERLAQLRESSVTNDPLLEVHAEFRAVLYAHPEAGGYLTKDFDTLFSSAFTQTLAFGLLLVREGSSESVGHDAYQHMPPEHPLMRTALRVLTQTEIIDVVGFGFTVLLDTVNSFSPQILATSAGQRDPILYFYEDFLSVFDPAARERHGVYFTPVEVVRFMTGALDRAAREHLGLSGLRDPALTVLDPATGTGTFLLGVVERVREAALAAGGQGRADLEVRALAGRIFGLELLVGPYAVAHYRLHHSLHQGQRSAGLPLPVGGLPRLGVYLADTLAEPGAAAPLGKLGFVSMGISEERRAADELKCRQRILAIIGNPPYRRLEEGEDHSLLGNWMNQLWDDLKRPVREAGKGNQLNTFPELSVAFWRWAMWKLFEAEGAPQRGVVAFISNRKFLTGWPCAGLRQMMRQRFDRIEIIDLRGDVRRGPRAGVERDVGVFDIQVGTAITIAIADGSRPGADAQVHYTDAWNQGRFARAVKLEWLASGADSGQLDGAIPVRRGPMDDFRPRPFNDGEWVSLRDCFEFHKSGMKSGNDATFIDADQHRLAEKVRHHLLELVPMKAFSGDVLRPLSYRPFDRRWLYNDLALLNRAGPDLQRVWGRENLALYALPGGTGAGPAAWCHGLLPDYHALRGSFGGYAFPLHNRRPEVAGSNVSTALLQGLAAAYGRAVKPLQVFDAILCLLTARSYTRRYAEDLEDVFPHLPFPADHQVFLRAATLGARIRSLQAFAASATVPSDLADSKFVRLVTAPTRGALLRPAMHEQDRLTLCSDGSGLIDGLPPALWSFEVSGFAVLQRWLEGRRDLELGLALFDEFRDICARISELLRLAAEADDVLADALVATLNRGALGLSPA